jgi:DNA integrity scanning protein DisA with diadenylate cyclase activity
MSNLSEYMHIITEKLYLINWRDSIEILVVSGFMYAFLCWLKKDTQKNLTYAFYAYSILFCGSYYAHMGTLHYLLLTGTPCAFILFIVLHQETLQRNFVMFRRAPKGLQELSSWTDELMRGCLTALNNNKELVIVIERNDSLKNVLYTPCLFYADLKKDIFDILVEKHICSHDYMLWVTHEGKLAAINASWRINLDEEWITQEAQALHKWKQDGIFISSKTDALIFKVKPLTRSFDLIMQGKIAEDISSEQLLAILQRNTVKPKPVQETTPIQPLASTSEKTL